MGEEGCVLMGNVNEKLGCCQNVEESGSIGTFGLGGRNAR